MNTARQARGSNGTQTSSLVYGGYSTAQSTLCESWDGSSWTEVADLNQSRSAEGAGASNTSALAFGGNVPPYSVLCESWNGSSWT